MNDDFRVVGQAFERVVRKDELFDKYLQHKEIAIVVFVFAQLRGTVGTEIAFMSNRNALRPFGAKESPQFVADLVKQSVLLFLIFAVAVFVESRLIEIMQLVKRAVVVNLFDGVG